MAEFDWDSGDDPVPLLQFLAASGRAGTRKLRLFLVACGRSVWGSLPDESHGQAVELLEHMADGGTWEGYQLATEPVREPRWAFRPPALPEAVLYAGRAVIHAVQSHGGPGYQVEFAHWVAHQAFAANTGQPGISDREERATQCRLLRDIVGDPFRPLPALAPLLSWGDEVIPRLARAAYEERVLPEGTLDATRLAILADALEDAGCDNKEILSHLREQGQVHVRGCWALDAVLGRS
jgi:hypothetical protein